MAGHFVHFALILSRYRAFLERLVVVLMGLAMSLMVVAMGKPWRQEWSELNFREYLFNRKN